MNTTVVAVRETVSREFGSWREFRRTYPQGGWLVQLAWLATREKKR